MKVNRALAITGGVIVAAAVCGGLYFTQDSGTGAPLAPDGATLHSVTPEQQQPDLFVEEPVLAPIVEEVEVVPITDSRELPTDSGEVLPVLEDSGEVIE